MEGITVEQIRNVSPDNAFIATSRRVSEELAALAGVELPAFQTMIRILIATIRETGLVIEPSINIFHPPLPPPHGKTGAVLAEFHMRVWFDDRHFCANVVLFCKLLDGCPYQDGSLPYTLMLTQAVSQEEYKLPFAWDESK